MEEAGFSIVQNRKSKKQNKTKNIPNERLYDTSTILQFRTHPEMIDAVTDSQQLEVIAKKLPAHAVAARIKIHEKAPNIVTVWDVIDAIASYEMSYFRCTDPQAQISSKRKPVTYSNYFSGPQTCEYLEPGLINVFKEFESFALLPLSEEEKKIPFLFLSKNKPWRPADSQEKVHSIVGKKTFLERFHIFTENQFAEWEEWQNMLIVGGAVVNCLLPIRKEFQADVGHYYHDVAYKTSDIDIYFYGLNEQQFTDKLVKLHRYLVARNKGKQVLVFKTPHTFTFVTEFPQRHIQIVLGKWDTREQILFEPDIDCSCFGFDGKTVWATQRARFSMNHRVIVASPSRYHVRGFPEYESRLVKYSKRGFVIWDRKLEWKKLSEQYIEHGVNRLNEHQGVFGRAGVIGLRLLVILHKYKEILEDTDIMTVLSGEVVPGNRILDNGIPYGRQWTNEKIEESFNLGIFRATSNYGVYKLNSRNHPAARIQLHKEVSEATAKTVFRTELLKLVTNNSNEDFEQQWYCRIFQKDYLKELVEWKNTHRDYPESTHDDLYYSLRVYYCTRPVTKSKTTFEDLILDS